MNISPPVIYYHSVAPELFEHWGFKFLTHRLIDFEDQLDYLKNKGYRTIFLDEWFAIRKGENQSTGKEVCLVFDDGFLDNWVYVFPMMKKHKMKFTIFIAPECIHPEDLIRPNLSDVWDGKGKESELDALGFVSWPELSAMHQSGLVDIQSHTMSHNKYIAGPKLEGYYYGHSNGVYPTWNTFPSIKPTYMAEKQFHTLLPFGTPIFEESSAVVTKIHYLNPDFTSAIRDVAVKFDLADKLKRKEFEREANNIYTEYYEAEDLFTNLESDQEYQARVRYEIIDSKRILEEKLNKSIQFLCWPHGDNSAELHAIACNAGYLATTCGKMTKESDHVDRIPRVGAVWSLGRWLNRQKFHYKIASHYQRQPFYSLWLVNELKNKLLKRA